jgi:hypothetical protein
MAATGRAKPIELFGDFVWKVNHAPGWKTSLKEGVTKKQFLISIGRPKSPHCSTVRIKNCEMKNYRTLIATMALSAILSQTASLHAAWAPVEGQLMTRWAKDVSADHALPDYPRPLMVRKEWQNLNGLWD